MSSSIPAAVQKIAECRDNLLDLERKIEVRQSEIKVLKEAAKEAEQLLDEAIQEARGLSTPSMFDGIDPTAPPPSPPPPPPAPTGTAPSGEVIDAEWTVSPPPVPAICGPSSPALPEPGWRGCPLDDLEMPEEIQSAVEDGLAPDRRTLGTVADLLDAGSTFGLEPHDVATVRGLIDQARADDPPPADWRKRPLDGLSLKPLVELKLLKAGVTTLGRLAYLLDTERDLGLGAADLRDVRAALEGAKAAAEPPADAPAEKPAKKPAKDKGKSKKPGRKKVRG